MLDNDEPWNPPQLQKLTQAPRLIPQVPEVTIISTENKPLNTKSNFIQRAFKPQTVSAETKIQVDLNSRPKFPTQDNRFAVGSASTFQNPTTNILREDNKNNRGYSPILTRPSVPDVTILDDSKESSKKSTEKVFTNSYKEMLINSHDQFLKQLSREESPTNNMQQAPLSRFKQNPLTKYVPSPQEGFNKNNFKDANSSSILSDIDTTQNIINNKKGENEEVTFKKVAEMLSEIQKLVITEKATESPNSSAGSDNLRSNHCEILNQLAKTYLTADELQKYQVNSELSELEKC